MRGGVGVGGGNMEFAWYCINYITQSAGGGHGAVGTPNACHIAACGFVPRSDSGFIQNLSFLFNREGSVLRGAPFTAG